MGRGGRCGPQHALKTDGTVVAWGGNSYGEATVPAGLSNVVAIAAGGDPANSSRYSLALKSDGTVVPWGSGEVLYPVIGLSNVIAIGGGGTHHALAVRSGPATPVIAYQPTDQFQVAGGSATFTTRGVGVYGVAYQWQHGGVDITGKTNSTLTLTNVQSASEGVYRVIVSNEIGSLASSNANFFLVMPPIIFSQSQPTNPVMIYQSNLTLSVVATAPGQYNGFPLGYKWQWNGSNIAAANAASFTRNADTNSSGTYSVLVTNLAGSTSAVWQATLTFEGSYIGSNTLAYHLSTNAAGYAAGHSPNISEQQVVSGWTYAFYTSNNMHLLTNAVWSTNCWLKGMQGLSATAIGHSNAFGGKALKTMVSPRHHLFATHTPASQSVAFLDTNNVVHWRRTLQWVNLYYDMAVGILDADLPATVEYLPVLPANVFTYLPSNTTSVVQGIGMNQQLMLFSQGMTMQSTHIPIPVYVGWDVTNSAPFGLGTNWNVPIVDGDSSAPERFLIHNQLVLVSHNYYPWFGPSTGVLFDQINEAMHYLSTNNNVGTDYQLTPFSLTNWPAIR